MFRYAPELVERFPSVVGGVVHAQGLGNGPSPSALRDAFAAEQQLARDRIGGRPLSELPSVAAWRRVFRDFGVDPTAYRSAAEALLRRLTKQGSIPSIGTLVDVGNLVSIRHALPVAVFDRRRLTGAVTVRFATGGEPFTDLGSGERESCPAGEVIFIDDGGLVCARRWCWRQGSESASGPETAEVMVTVEGHDERARESVAAAVADLEALLAAHAGPTALASAVLDGGRSEFGGIPAVDPA
ncbi:MAG TPA: phenylalanine--tRNA ligase beta subunit-related protein [Candidatus Limnocylindrales bacterium]|jgi:DNA/RNA-binding domain of Phe-tRNA-synthetase-like protein